MTKTLLLIRHADCEPERSFRSDFDRSLTEHGRLHTEHMARYLGEQGLIPDRILFSSARRARETVEGMVSAFGKTDADLQETCILYMATLDQITSVVRLSPDHAETIAVVGHNPGVACAALFLSGPETEIEIVDRVTLTYPPASVSVLRFELDHWRDIGQTRGKLEQFFQPRDS